MNLLLFQMRKICDCQNLFSSVLTVFTHAIGWVAFCFNTVFIQSGESPRGGAGIKEQGIPYPRGETEDTGGLRRDQERTQVHLCD